jgi:hypothetical protein
LRGLALAEVAAADLDVTIVGQLAAAQLALGDQLKPRPLQVVRLKAFLRRHSAINGTSISCRFSHTLDPKRAFRGRLGDQRSGTIPIAKSERS